MARKLLKVGLGIIVALVLLLGVVWLMIDRIAAAGIEKGVTYATEVKTSIGGVSLSLVNSQLVTKNLTIGNPEGYSTPHLMKIGKMDVSVDRGTLTSDRIVVRHFEMSDLDLYIEQKPGSNNVAVITANLKRLDSAGGDKPKEKEGGKKVVVNQVTIHNVVAHVQLLPIGGHTSVLDVTVPEIILKDVASDNAGGGVTISELTAKLLPAILMAVVKKGEGIIPADLNMSLQSNLVGLTNLMGSGGAQLKQGFEGATKGAGQTLEGLFGGQKKPAAQKPRR